MFVPARRFAENDMDAPLEASEERYEGLERDCAATLHPEAGELQTVKSGIKGHGEQAVLPGEWPVRGQRPVLCGGLRKKPAEGEFVPYISYQ